MKSILKLFAGLSATEIIGRAFNFLSFVIIARFIDKAKFGDYNLIVTLISFFIVLLIMSSDNYGIKELVKKEKEGFVEDIIFLRILLFIPLSLIFLILLYLLYPQLYNLANILSGLFFLSSFIIDYNWVIIAGEKVKPVVKAKLFSGMLNLILVIIITNYRLDIYLLLLILGLGNYLFNIILIRYRPVKFNKLKIDFPKYRKILKDVSPLALSSLLIIIYYHVDILIIGLYGKQTDVAEYSAAYKVLLLMVVPATLLFKSFIPELSKENKSAGLAKLLMFSSSLGFIVSLPVYLFSGEILMLLYGASYKEAFMILKILSFSSFIIYLNIPICNKFIIEGKNYFYMKIILAGAILNLAGNLFVIPQWGVIGASVITVLTELLILLIGGYLRCRAIKNK